MTNCSRDGMSEFVEIWWTEEGRKKYTRICIRLSLFEGTAISLLTRKKQKSARITFSEYKFILHLQFDGVLIMSLFFFRLFGEAFRFYRGWNRFTPLYFGPVFRGVRALKCNNLTFESGARRTSRVNVSAKMKGKHAKRLRGDKKRRKKGVCKGRIRYAFVPRKR